jgi:hypothetical protein
VLRRLALLGLVAVALAGCGGNAGDDTTTSAAMSPVTTTATTTEPKPEAVAFRAYFFRDGVLEPVTVMAPPTKAVARAALEQLLEGPRSGYHSAIPGGVELEDVGIEDGVATASFSARLGAPTREAQGQIVSTLTQFPTVRGVRIEVDGKPVALQDENGGELTRPARAADFADLARGAFIVVKTPVSGATVSSPVKASGTAIAFEATIAVDIRQGADVVDTKTITASAGAPERGTWSTQLDLPQGDVTLAFYEPSAEDGSHLHETEVQLHVK